MKIFSLKWFAEIQVRIDIELIVEVIEYYSESHKQWQTYDTKVFRMYT